MNLYSYGLHRTQIDALQTLPQQALVGATAGVHPGFNDEAGNVLKPLAADQAALYAAKLNPNSAAARFSPTNYGSVARREYPGLYGYGAPNSPSQPQVHSNTDAIDTPGYFDQHVDPVTGTDEVSGLQYVDEMKQRAIAEAGGPTAFRNVFPGGPLVSKSFFSPTQAYVPGATGMQYGVMPNYPMPPGRAPQYAPPPGSGGATIIPAPAPAPAPTAAAKPASPLHRTTPASFNFANTPSSQGFNPAAYAENPYLQPPSDAQYAQQAEEGRRVQQNRAARMGALNNGL